MSSVSEAKLKEIEERRDYVIEVIKESGEAGVTVYDVAQHNLNVGRESIRRLMFDLQNTVPEIQKKPKSSYRDKDVYAWIPVQEKKSEPEKRETHSAFLKNRYEKYEKPNRNSEGYKDPTASAAISKVDLGVIESLDILPADGEIWTAKESNNTSSYIYVISTNSGACQCIKLRDIETVDKPELVLHALRVKIGDMTLFGDCSRITNKPIKYLIKRERTRVAQQLASVRREVCSVLGIDPFRKEVVEKEVPVEKIVEKEVVKEVPVEKIVEKKVEVPVEKIVYKEREVPEGCITEDQAAIVNLGMQVEIWKTVATELLKSRN